MAARADDLLRVTEGAKLLNVHEDTLYQWIRKGAVPHVRVGPEGRTLIRLRRSVIEDLARDIQNADLPSLGAAKPPTF